MLAKCLASVNGTQPKTYMAVRRSLVEDFQLLHAERHSSSLLNNFFHIWHQVNICKKTVCYFFPLRKPKQRFGEAVLRSSVGLKEKIIRDIQQSI